MKFNGITEALSFKARYRVSVNGAVGATWRYHIAYKREVMRLASADNMSHVDVARQLDMGVSTVAAWATAFRQGRLDDDNTVAVSRVSSTHPTIGLVDKLLAALADLDAAAERIESRKTVIKTTIQTIREFSS
jgi:transposase-like protein